MHVLLLCFRIYQRMIRIVGYAMREEKFFVVINVLASSTCSVVDWTCPLKMMLNGCVQCVRCVIIFVFTNYVLFIKRLYIQCVLLLLFLLFQNISRKQKRSRPYGLKDLLLLAVQRMMFQGVSIDHTLLFINDFIIILQTEIFQKSVPEDLIEHYREYIFHPMHMGMIKEVCHMTIA